MRFLITLQTATLAIIFPFIAVAQEPVAKSPSVFFGVSLDGWQVVAAIAAAFAAVAAWRSANASRKGVEAQLVTQFLEEYSSKEMRDALHAVRKAVGSNLFGMEAGIRQIPDDVDLGRRKVHYYFKKAYRLYERGFLSRASLELIVDVNAYSLLYEAVEPLSRNAMPGKADESKFAWFAELKKLVPLDD